MPAAIFILRGCLPYLHGIRKLVKDLAKAEKITKYRRSEINFETDLIGHKCMAVRVNTKHPSLATATNDIYNSIAEFINKNNTYLNVPCTKH